MLFSRLGAAKERSEIRNILWTIDIVSCEDLQGDQMGRVGRADTEISYQRFRLGVAANGDDHVSISSEPWLRARRNSEAPDKRERDVSVGEGGANLA